MPIFGAYLGGPEPEIAAGYTGVSLCMNTQDRENLGSASFRITNAGFDQTVAGDSTGRAFVTVPSSDTEYVVELTHGGEYSNDGPQRFIARSASHVGVFFDLHLDSGGASTIVRVLTNSAGTTITGTSGSDSVTAVSDSGGVAEFRGLPVGSTWTFTDGSKTEAVMMDRLLIIVDFTTVIPQVINEVSFGMSFNNSTFASDPAGCLVYTGGCAEFTPVSSPPSSLGPCSVLGSWDMNEDGSSSNPFLDSCFYATFDAEGNLHQRLNPKNLAQVIGMWDADRIGWRPASGPSSIESENTMFCFPALYRSGNDTSVTIGTNAQSGTAYGATIDGHTYQYEAIGVYMGYVQDNKLMSLSGKVSSASITRPDFRTYAAANKVKNGKAIVWNFHQWRDWWHLYLFGAKSFNGQVAIGKGGFDYEGSVGQGLCNAMGLWAGSTSRAPSTATSVKALIENPWGYKSQFIDDFIASGGIKVGQNSTPDDTTSNKISGQSPSGSGWQGGHSSTGAFWGLCTTVNGNSSAYQCDYYRTASGVTLGAVGGYSGDVLEDRAGPSCMDARGSLSSPGSSYGARLAFVFDLEV